MQQLQQHNAAQCSTAKGADKSPAVMASGVGLASSLDLSSQFSGNASKHKQQSGGAFALHL